jgi:hypothetical protein
MAWIGRLDSAYPPNRLPKIPPTAMDDQDNDCRSPANCGLERKVVSFGGLSTPIAVEAWEKLTLLIELILQPLHL